MPPPETRYQEAGGMKLMTRRRRNGVTIRAVAERAGVSAMTVSNVLNGAGRASAATIATVRAAIAELGYVPNLAARRLAKARATTTPRRNPLPTRHPGRRKRRSPNPAAAAAAPPAAAAAMAAATST